MAPLLFYKTKFHGIYINERYNLRASLILPDCVYKSTLTKVSENCIGYYFYPTRNKKYIQHINKSTAAMRIIFTLCRIYHPCLTYL